MLFPVYITNIFLPWKREQNLTEKETKLRMIWAEDLQGTYMYLLQKVHADCQRQLQNLLVPQDSYNFCTEN